MSKPNALFCERISAKSGGLKFTSREQVGVVAAEVQGEDVGGVATAHAQRLGGFGLAQHICHSPHQHSLVVTAWINNN